MRKKIVAGNWKMNHDLAQTEMFLVGLKKQVFPENIEIVIAPAFTNLYHAFQSLHEHPVVVAAQNMHQSEAGAFTGEISAGMLKSVGVEIVILGHSERRSFFNEDEALLADKVNTALKYGITAIFCIGESLKERKDGKHFDVIKKQLREGLFHISEEGWNHIVIAYEPVWAIGTGENATPAQVQEMHQFIRKTIAGGYTEAIAKNVSILYGGSVKPENASGIFKEADVDGALVGGASLEVETFMEIVNALDGNFTDR